MCLNLRLYQVVQPREFYVISISLRDGFTQGVIEFLDGGNKGLKRTIRLHEQDVLLLTLPLLELPKTGQRINIYPGCDKRLETCQNRFNNFARFRGAPFIPIPETSV